MFGHMLPYEGWICTAKKMPKGFAHRFFESMDEAEKYCLEEDRKGAEVYLAQSSFLTKDNRRQENVKAVRSFWLDIDCGPKKPYATQGEGALALKDFCHATGLPMPVVTNSGNGLYAHWALTDDVPPQQWRDTACLLKSITTAFGLLSDDSRTSDSASVLRPAGTRNKKDPENPKPVRVIAKAEEVPFSEFRSILEACATKAGLGTSSPSVASSSRASLNADFLVPHDGPPSKADKVRARCAQIEFVATRQPEVEEPLWYAMIALVRHCVDGSDWAHVWSKEHPDYDEKTTDQKLKQLESRGIGPTKCEKFESLNPTGCVGCPHKGEITSPIQLGKEYEAVEPTLPVEDAPRAEKPELPYGFQLTKQGLVMTGDDPVLFYDNELYVTDLAWDESLGYETAAIRHYLPHEGWNEFKIRSALTNDPKSLHMALADNHVKIVGSERKKAMGVYIESYLAKIQRSRKMSQLVCQMGWKEDGRFVLGRTVILPDGSAEPVALAKSVPLSVEAFHTAGELEPWVEATRIFDSSPDMLPLAFAFCAGAFGAPLMKFAGYPGAMVSMLGPSGVGKTLVGTWLLSTYGKADRLMMLKDDTRNSLIGRLGAYGNLPLYVDEVTNSDPEELSDLTYRITQGRDKARLNRDATERKVNNHWQTLAVVSSNASIVDKLSGMKQDASPELNRVLEFSIPQTEVLTRDVATGIYRTITENYGHAGVAYIRYLVEHQADHREYIDRIVAEIDKRTEAKNEERYWSAIAGATLYGAACAKKLGLVRFDTAKLFDWVVRMVMGMRDTKRDVVNTSVDSLGQMLDDYINNRLVIGKNDSCIVLPKGPLYVRVETDTDFMFISRGKVQEWCHRNHASYTGIRRSLEAMRVLVDPNKRKVLGARTEMAGTQQPCWVIDLKSPQMGKYQVSLSEDLRKMKGDTP